jgi:hypothetical protein
MKESFTATFLRNASSSAIARRVGCGSGTVFQATWPCLLLRVKRPQPPQADIDGLIPGRFQRSAEGA